MMLRSLLLSAVLFSAPHLKPATAQDVVTAWNEIANQVLVADVVQQHPGQSSRTLAMMNVAMHDAFRLTGGGQTFYNYAGQLSGAGASRDAAAVQAAYSILDANYPIEALSIDLESLRAMSLGMIPDGPEKNSGINLGSAIGQSIVDRRAGDGYDAISQYLPSPLPGHWESDPLGAGVQEAWGPEWGKVSTFSINSGRQFTAPAPPALDTPEYAAAFDEVKDLGALVGSSRTADETEIGLFWAYDRIGLGTPLRLFNQVLLQLAEQQMNTPEENAELFARASVAMADAGIASWNSKYDYDLWRPVSAILCADEDGNALTVADPNWRPLGAPGDDPLATDDDFTPPFPTYVSGHATFGGALFTTLADFYGDDGIGFSLTSEEMPGVTRSFDSFSQAMIENGRSRVYLGLHFNFDDLEGQSLGAEVADDIAGRPFVAIPEPGALVLALLAMVGFLPGPRRG